MRQDRLVDAALEALAGIGAHVVAAAGARDAHGIEQRAFDEALGGVLVAAGVLAADDAAERLGPRGIGDDAVLIRQRIGLAVQREDLLAGARHAHGQRAALHLGDVEDMQRAAEAVGVEVRHIDQRVDRPEPDRHQQVLQPLRARPVLHVAHCAAQHPGAGARIGDLPAQRRGIAGLDLRLGERLEATEAGGGQVARDALHAERVAAVRRDADLDDRVVEPGILHVALAERRVLRQVDDAGVVVAEAHLARREHHRLRRHAADLALLQRDAGAGDEGAGQREHALHAGPRIGRAADD